MTRFIIFRSKTFNDETTSISGTATYNNEETTATLTFDPITAGNAGDYKCIASFAGASGIESDTATVAVYGELQCIIMQHLIMYAFYTRSAC